MRVECMVEGKTFDGKKSYVTITSKENHSESPPWDTSHVWISFDGVRTIVTNGRELIEAIRNAMNTGK